MNLLPLCLCFTRDPELVRRLSAHMQTLALVRPIEERAALETALQQFQPALVVLDLGTEDSCPLLSRIRAEWPDTVIIALGLPGSEPLLDAEAMGVFAVEPRETDRLRIQRVVSQALGLMHLAEENRFLRQRAAGTGEERISGTAAPSLAQGAPPPLYHFSRLFRHFDNVDAVAESIVDAVAGYARVVRVGLFVAGRMDGIYRLRAGVKCLEDTRKLVVPREAPLVQWMQIHAHLIARDMLSRLEDSSEYFLLKQSLDALGAEVIIPLHGRAAIMGWIFLGHRVTGAAFAEPDLEDLMVLAEHVALTLENALLYEEAAIQKTLAETVLRSIPVGIVAVDGQNVVRWFNATASTVLDTPADSILKQDAGRLDGQLADLLNRCLKDEPRTEPAVWNRMPSRRLLSAITRRLTNEGRCLGAVAILHDLTPERELREKQEHAERSLFWTELAAAISHEVRNPLVAISTFAQLLPERYNDEEFRNQFSDLAAKEISRLDRMVDQINAFANPPELVFRPLAVDALLQRAVERALRGIDAAGVRIEKNLSAGLPKVRGDADALIDCCSHLLSNSIEALQGTPNRTIRMVASLDTGGNGKPMVSLRFEDNGPGIPVEIREKVFSPFCTTKPRGIGLGLPIVQRTVLDHGGRVKVESGDKGTRVTLTLPADLSPVEEENGEG